MMQLRRIARRIALAILGAAVIATVMSRRGVLQADGGGSCSSAASASASSYDGSTSGSSSGGVDVAGYTAESCVGLAQTNAIFQAGLACENAGIPAGLAPGLGYAVVSWYVVWSDGNETLVTAPDQPQQYDCGDTFS